MKKSPAKSPPQPRSGIWKFGDEIAPPDAFSSDEERMEWELAKAGIFEDPRSRLERLKIAARGQFASPALDDILEKIGYAQLLLSHMSVPPGEPWELWRAGRAWLLFHIAIGIGSDLAAATFDGGETGAGIYRERRQAEARKRGAAARHQSVERRNIRIRRALQSIMSDGASYQKALNNILDDWPEEWGRVLSESQFRKVFPKKKFSHLSIRKSKREN